MGKISSPHKILYDSQRSYICFRFKLIKISFCDRNDEKKERKKEKKWKKKETEQTKETN